MCIIMRFKLVGVAVMVAGWLFAGSATAGITGTTGQIDLLSTPPASLVPPHDPTSDTSIFTFNERTGLVLPSSVSVDITSAGTYQSNASLTSGTVAAGTDVDSYFLHTDPASGSSMYDGSVTFSTPILGVIVLSHTLDLSDSVLGAPGTTYPTGNADRGLELSANQDFVTLSNNMETLTVHFFTHGDIDEVRVITAAVPEPSSIVLAACGILFLTVALRTPQRRSA
jgi:hypothetical protein